MTDLLATLGATLRVPTISQLQLRPRLDKPMPPAPLAHFTSRLTTLDAPPQNAWKTHIVHYAPTPDGWYLQVGWNDTTQQWEDTLTNEWRDANGIVQLPDVGPYDLYEYRVALVVDGPVQRPYELVIEEEEESYDEDEEYDEPYEDDDDDLAF